MNKMTTKLLAMVQFAKDNKLLLLVSEIRYAIAGIPDEINDEYISFPANALEVASTGKLGEAIEEYEIQPWPKVISMKTFCFAEFVLPPKGYKGYTDETA